MTSVITALSSWAWAGSCSATPRAGKPRLAAETFARDFEEMNTRHHLAFDTYQDGKSREIGM